MRKGEEVAKERKRKIKCEGFMVLGLKQHEVACGRRREPSCLQ